jgi:hypothetical protein
MRIGVIRGDLPGPLYITDLEVVSQQDPAIEPKGQEGYYGRPNPTRIEAALASPSTGAGASVVGTAITFPLTINAGNQTLRVKTSAAGSFTALTVATGSYATIAALVIAVNAALTGSGVVAEAGNTTNTLVLESATRGVTSYLAIDSVANGSTFNGAANFGSAAVTATMPVGTDFIAACLPVGGPLDARTATINGVGASTAANALARIPAARGTTAAVQNLIAPRVIETPVALQSYQVGEIAKARGATFNPDPNRLPSGAAIVVVADDGNSAFSAPLPTLTTAATGVSSLTLTGTGLGTFERKLTSVKIAGALNKTLSQDAIEHAGGSVSATSIVIPNALVPGLVAVTSTVQVKVMQRASLAVATT